MYEFMLRTIVGTFEHPITQDLQLSHFGFALLSSTAYLIIYAIMQVPVGMIVDRIGLRKSLLLATIVCIISNVIFAWAQSIPVAMTARMITGFGSAFGFICLIMAVYDWLPAKKRALYIGISQFIGTLGPLAAAGPLQLFIIKYNVSWREIFLMLSGIGLGILFISYFILDNKKTVVSKYVILKKPSATKDSLKSHSNFGQLTTIAIFAACAYFLIEYFSEAAGKTYLGALGFNPLVAASALSTSWLGYAIGCPLLGFISDRNHSRRIAIILGTIAMIIAFVLIQLADDSAAMLNAAMFMLGIGASGQSICYALAAENTKTAYRARALGFINAVVITVTAVNAPMLGAIIDLMSKSSTETQAYPKVIGACFVVVIMLMIIAGKLVKETWNKSATEPTFIN